MGMPSPTLCVAGQGVAVNQEFDHIGDSSSKLELTAQPTFERTKCLSSFANQFEAT
jgi:hypothetical protein